jgi:hypothetical protein
VHDVGQACPLALQDGREVEKRLADPVPNRGTDDLGAGVAAVLPADMDRAWLDVRGLEYIELATSG